MATARQVEPETLEDRLTEELTAADAVLAYPNLVSAWGTID